LLPPLRRCRARAPSAGDRRRPRRLRGARRALGPKKGIDINGLLANVKRAISGSYHAIRQGKYARLYLAEAAYRFAHPLVGIPSPCWDNRRFRLREMLPRLARAMMLCKPHPEPTLRMASNFHG
jgi:hypothetical protein